MTFHPPLPPCPPPGSSGSDGRPLEETQDKDGGLLQSTADNKSTEECSSSSNDVLCVGTVPCNVGLVQDHLCIPQIIMYHN